MSESSASASINTNLTNSFFSSNPQEFYNWFSFNMKLLVFVVVLFVLLSLVFFPASLDYDIMYDNINRMKRGCPRCRRFNCRGECLHARRTGCPYCRNSTCRGGCNQSIIMRKIMIKPLMRIQTAKRIQRPEMQNSLKQIMSGLAKMGVINPPPPSLTPANLSMSVPAKLISPTLVPTSVTVPAKVVAPIVGPVKPVPSGIQTQIGRIEKFSNEDMMSFSYERNSEYQSIPLLALFDENKNPMNLFFGQANRHIIAKDSKLNYRLEIYCNLPVLDGNIYDTSPKVKQMYKVILINTKKNEKIFLDELKKDGDGIYKIKFNSLEKNKEARDYIDYDKIQIVYSVDGKENVLLEGKYK